MCDATEIDEILALRVLTLTDDEKREARATDPRAAAIVDRVRRLRAEIFERLHGAIRSLRPAPSRSRCPWWEPAVDAAVDPWTDPSRIGGGRRCGKGARSAAPWAAAGRRTDATICSSPAGPRRSGRLLDVDGEHHLAVTLDDDPAADLHQSHGRFLYFHPDEVEPLAMTDTNARRRHRQHLQRRRRLRREVAQRLAGAADADGVHVEDYGIRGVHLAYELLEGYDSLVLVDALPGGDPPGTVSVLEPERRLGEHADPLDSPPDGPAAVLGMVAELGGEIGRVLVVGCEPADSTKGSACRRGRGGRRRRGRMVESLIAERKAGCSA